jgi:TetR/AcrR family transcriptional regulator, transcriptional repressor for nem operon
MTETVSPNAAKPAQTRRDQILDVAELLIQTRGFSAFSYQDVADAIGIRKASIHYHFASKTDLGIAVVDRYDARFSDALQQAAADASQSSMSLLDVYTRPFRAFALTPDMVCLSAALAGEMMALPDTLRVRVSHFFAGHQAWLTQIMERGANSGEFHLWAPPVQMARMAFASLQGALLVKRTTGDASQLADVIAALKAQIVVSDARATAHP